MKQPRLDYPVSQHLSSPTDGSKSHLVCDLEAVLWFHFFLSAVPWQLTAFAYKDYLSFGYVHVGLREAEEMTRQYNVNVHAPTILIFKEHVNKPADVIQVRESFMIALYLGPSDKH